MSRRILPKKAGSQVTQMDELVKKKQNKTELALKMFSLRAD